ncbi:DNA adenine methylase [Salmonella enterica subsp. enterica serovar Typhimurium str. DT104]|nr:DNA adenine methylase [Salmonella enterica subsp. enterica serovar Typhimurium str. DT104]
MTHIMDHTMEMREKGGRYVFLVKAATSETWWPEDADHIMFIRGRIGFDLPVWFVPADDKQKTTGAFFAGAIAIFDKSWRGERFSYISRTELEEKGKAFMSLVEFAAGKVQPGVLLIALKVKLAGILLLRQTYSRIRSQISGLNLCGAVMSEPTTRR